MAEDITIDEITTEDLNDWTIMVYMAGDNNLSQSMASAINDAQIRGSVGTSNKVSMLAYFDSSVNTIPPLYCDITNSEKFNIYQTDTYQNYIKPKPHDVESSSSVDSIINFVKWCIEEKNYKAKNYALFLSGHSNAFDEDTLLIDSNSKTVLTIPELASALRSVHFIINADKDDTKPLDILGFDSCVMGMLEIGYEFRDLAKYFIVSQGETPNAGWNYGNILYDFARNTANKSKTTREIAQDIVISYINTQNKFALGGLSADISVWDLDELNNVIEKVKNLFDIFRRHLLFDKPQTNLEPEVLNNDEKHTIKDFQLIMRQQILKSILWAHWNCQTHWFEQAIDIKDFCDVLFEDFDFLKNQFEALPNFANLDEEILDYLGSIIENVGNACNEVRSAIAGKCVIGLGIVGADYQYSNGMSLFFPWTSRAFELMKSPYLSLSFASKRGGFWINFLEDYLRESLRRNDSGVTKQIPWVNVGSTEATSNGETTDPRGVRTDLPRGVRTDLPRGVRTDLPRGVRTDLPRGIAAFMNTFKTVKNYDSDNWEYFLPLKWLPTDKIKNLEFSDSLKVATTKLNTKINDR
jgi:Clostripain family